MESRFAGRFIDCIGAQLGDSACGARRAGGRPISYEFGVAIVLCTVRIRTWPAYFELSDDHTIGTGFGGNSINQYCIYLQRYKYQTTRLLSPRIHDYPFPPDNVSGSSLADNS